jgi:hypothetical protein
MDSNYEIQTLQQLFFDWQNWREQSKNCQSDKGDREQENLARKLEQTHSLTYNVAGMTFHLENWKGPFHFPLRFWLGLSRSSLL